VIRAFNERWHVQAQHPDVGPAAATVNYGVALAKFCVRYALRRVLRR
jgi:hypothetical protein